MDYPMAQAPFGYETFIGRASASSGLDVDMLRDMLWFMGLTIVKSYA